jgi:uncharacterized protein HemY
MIVIYILLFIVVVFLAIILSILKEILEVSLNLSNWFYYDQKIVKKKTHFYDPKNTINT